MIDSPPPIQLHIANPAAGPGSSVTAAPFVGAEILRFQGKLYWTVLDIDPDVQPAHPQDRRLRLWEIDDVKATALPLGSQRFDLPPGHEASYVVSGNQLFLLLANNQETPAKLLRWDLTKNSNKTDPWRALNEPPAVANVGLPMEIAFQVRLEPAQRWSTAGLPPEAWLFNPRLRTDRRGAVNASLDTVDGHTCVLEVDSATGAFRPIALPAFRAVAPIVTHGHEGDILFARGPDPGWSGYFDDPILSFSRGPVALPLVCGIGGQQGRFTEADAKSPPALVGTPCYAFDVAARPDGEEVLGLVVGQREKPVLLLYSYIPPLARDAVPLSVPLDGPVARLRLAATNKRISICVVYRLNAQYRVAFYYRALP